MKQPVVIGRFQVPSLTAGHKMFLQAVYDEFAVWPVILLGVAPLPQTPNNPLTFEQRKQAILEDKGKVIQHIYPVLDMPTDEMWSHQVDTLLGALLHGKEPVLCGGRDSFLPHYRGKYVTWEAPVQLNPLSNYCPYDSATEIRKSIAEDSHYEFRRGAVWATQQQFPKIDSTVDLLITKWVYPTKSEDNQRVVLIGRKADGRWVFPGGYIDVRERAEAAARRELLEETGLSDGHHQLLGTYVVNDWRYRSEKRMNVLTHVFHVDEPIGGAKGADDLEEVKWVDVDLVQGIVIPAHADLWSEFKYKI